MIPGEWYIEDWKIPWVIKADYSMEKIELECAALIDGENDPRLEIDSISEYSCFPYSQDIDIQGGIIPQSILGIEPLTITDGYEVFKGYLSYPKFKEDGWATQFIEYKLTIILWNELEVEEAITDITDGDEITYDDGWEQGFETYNPPASPAIDETNSSPPAPVVVAKPTVITSTVSSNSGGGGGYAILTNKPSHA